MSSGPWVLPEDLRQLAEADENLVREVLSIFRTDTADRLSKLKAALAGHDRMVVKHQAHAMKGSAGQVGAMEVAKICQQLEAEAMSGSPDALKELASRVEAAFEEVQRFMSQ